MKAKRALMALGAATAMVAGAAAVAATRRWVRADDPCRTDGDPLAEADSFKVTTDDGAVLDGLAAGPEGGPVVVLSHCWTGNRSVWAPVAGRLAGRGHRVVLYDQRGHGASTLGTAEATIARLGADLGQVLEAVDARDAVVAGHSMGGMTIMALLSDAPTGPGTDFPSGAGGAGERSGTAADTHARAGTGRSNAAGRETATGRGTLTDTHGARDTAEAASAVARVRAAVLVSTGAGQVVRRPLLAAGRRTLGRSRVDRLLASPAGPVLMRATVGRNPRIGHLAATRDAFLATAPDVRLTFFAAISAMDLRSALGSVTVPTTVVVGSRDLLTPPAQARVIAAAIPGARLVTVPGAGHMLPFEDPDVLADLIEEASL